MRRRGRIWYVKDAFGQYVSSGTDNPDNAKALEAKHKQERWERAKFPDIWRKLDSIPKRTLKEACVKWLNEHQHQTGAKANATFFRFWIEQYGENTLLSDINREKTHLIIAHRTTEHASKENGTANNYVHALKKVINQAKIWHTEDEPWYQGDAPSFRYYPVGQGRSRVLSVTEWLALRASLGDDLGDMAQFSLSTLLREGNVFSITPSHIREGCVYFRADEMKGKLPHSIPLNETAQAVIERRLKQHPVIGNGRIFTFRGKPIDHLRGTAHTAFREAVARSGIPHVTFHDLRRTAASWLAARGVPEDIRMRLGAWKRKGTMNEHYIHFEVESLRPHIAIIDEVLRGNVVQIGVK